MKIMKVLNTETSMHMKNKKMNIESYDQKIMKLEHEDNADNKLT